MLKVAIAAVIAAVLVLSLVGRVGAHGEADWIDRGGYKNAVGELCCGKRDCFALRPGDVREVPTGYFVRSKGETVPFSEALPSPDGQFWRCEWGGQRKCFFAPVPTF